MKNAKIVKCTVVIFTIFLSFLKTPGLCQQPDYYPLKVGYTWNYINIKEPNKLIARVTHHQDWNQYLIEETWILSEFPSFTNAKIVEKRDFEILLIMTGSGLLGYQSLKDKIPPEPILKLPLELNKKWVYKSNDERITYTVTNLCNIKIKAGDFSNVFVVKRVIETHQNGKYKYFSKTFRYYAPDIGLILESFTDDTLKLKSDETSKEFELSSLENFVY